MHHAPLRTSALVLSLLAGTALMSACDRPSDNRTAARPNNDVVARVERRDENAADKAREAGRDAGQAMDRAGDAVANKARDMAITTTLNAKLAADDRLSALGINVDTVGGRVVLRGSAPDTAARARATELARSTDGVVDVVNELNVQPRR